MINTDKIYAESIVNEYSVKKTTKVVQLKKLDKKAKRPALVTSLTFGIISALILGIGMCLAMEVGGLNYIIIGSIIGIIGIIGMAINYPIYNKLLSKNKEKYAGAILELAKEITQDC